MSWSYERSFCSPKCYILYDITVINIWLLYYEIQWKHRGAVEVTEKELGTAKQKNTDSNVDKNTVKWK